MWFLLFKQPIFFFALKAMSSLFVFFRHFDYTYFAGFSYRLPNFKQKMILILKEIHYFLVLAWLDIEMFHFLFFFGFFTKHTELVCT